jgi:hypothetical protein
MNLTVTVKQFESHAARLAAIARTEARARLLKMGAFVRTRARGLLRRRNKPSAPGTPPAVHSKDTYANLKNIRFALEGDANLVVGPCIWNSQTNRGLPAPGAHEQGGRVTIRRRTAEAFTAGGRRRRAQNQGQADRYYTLETVTFPQRKFMLPAYEHEAKKWPDLFKDFIT